MKVAVARLSSMGKQQLQEMELEVEPEMEPCKKLLHSAHDNVDDNNKQLQDPIALPLKRFNSICIFCGNSRGKKGIFSDIDFSLGQELVGLLKVDGYYNPLLALFDKALKEGFKKFPARSIVVSAGTPSELLDKLEAYTPIHDPRVPKLHWEDAERLVYGPAVSNAAAQ